MKLTKISPFFFPSSKSYATLKTTDRYLEGKIENALDNIQDFVFGTGDLDNLAYTTQKR